MRTQLQDGSSHCYKLSKQAFDSAVKTHSLLATSSGLAGLHGSSRGEAANCPGEGYYPPWQGGCRVTRGSCCSTAALYCTSVQSMGRATTSASASRQHHTIQDAQKRECYGMCKGLHSCKRSRCCCCLLHSDSAQQNCVPHGVIVSAHVYLRSFMLSAVSLYCDLLTARYMHRGAQLLFLNTL